MVFLSAVVVVAVVSVVSGNPTVEQGEGEFCRSTVEQDLDKSKLKGLWVEKESKNTDSFVDKNDKCHFSYFYPSDDGSKIEVSEDYILPNGEHKKTSYVITDEDPDNDGDLVTHLNILHPKLGKTKVEYDILETDYVNFMLVQICHDAKGTEHDFKTQMLLVRDTEGVDLESGDANKDLVKSLDANKLDRSEFEVNDVKSCKAVTFPSTFVAAEAA